MVSHTNAFQRRNRRCVTSAHKRDLDDIRIQAQEHGLAACYQELGEVIANSKR